MPNSISSQEQSAKNWQLTVIEKRLEQNEKLNEKVDAKLDSIIQNMVTMKQYDDRILSVQRDVDSKVATAVKEINLEYGPMKKSLTWLTRALVVAALALAGQFVIFFTNYIGAGK